MQSADFILAPLQSDEEPRALRNKWGGARRTVQSIAVLTIVAAACGRLQLPTDTTAGPAVNAGPPVRTTPGAPEPTVGSGASGGFASGMPGGRRRVALLLPLSGAQRPLAEAVRDGFLAAYLDSQVAGATPEIVVLDEERPNPVDAYRNAVAGGVDIVVGPLMRESVAQVAGVAGATPTLTLNYLDSGVSAPGGFYQFALSPEDEARQTAMRASADGHLRALALLPDNEWGRRMLAAFTPALAERGGTLLASRFYDPATTDYTAVISPLLLLDESSARQRQLAANLGVSLEFEPRRRADVDFIFLAANVSAGRLIRPQLRFLYADDIPTYSTSAIYQPGAAGDADLEGVMFVDVPALIGPDSQAESLRATLTRRWPAGSLGRLRFYAMGFDAYQLMTALFSGTVADVPGLTGRLSVDAYGRIHREMPWAVFRGGRIDPLPGAVAMPAPALSQQ